MDFDGQALCTQYWVNWRFPYDRQIRVLEHSAVRLRIYSGVGGESSTVWEFMGVCASAQLSKMNVS